MIEFKKYLLIIFGILMITTLTLAGDPIIKGSEDAVLWAGLDFPNSFDAKNIEDGSRRDEILEKGLISLEKAAELGSRKCIEVLADYYINVLKDQRLGIYWCYQAASCGSVEAMTILRHVYFNGEGVVKNYVEAYKWAFLAAALGSEKDKKIINEMSQNDPNYCSFIEGQHQAQIWEQTHQKIFPRIN